MPAALLFCPALLCMVSILLFLHMFHVARSFLSSMPRVNHGCPIFCLCLVLQSLWSKRCIRAQNHQQRSVQYGKRVLLQDSIYEWIEKLNNGCTSIKHLDHYGNKCDNFLDLPLVTNHGGITESCSGNSRVWNGNIHNSPARKNLKANHPQEYGCLQFSGTHREQY
jgi:hypothetical protein